jgi:hypothetical protein
MIAKLKELFDSKISEPIKDSEQLCAEASLAAVIAIKLQIKFACLGGDMTNLSTRVGSLQSMSYILGYCKALHHFHENRALTHINDGTLNLSVIMSIFTENSAEECVQAMNKTYHALEDNIDNTQLSFRSGKSDYESWDEGTISASSGLVSILGVGRS